MKYLGINLRTVKHKPRKLKKIQRDVKTFHVPGLEELSLKYHTTQSNLQIQCNLYQITHDILNRTRINNPKMYMEPQKTQN